MLSVSPFELSGGQERRVAIAGILAMEPEVLILDEPAAGLDPMGREDILGGVRSYQRQRGNTVIIVSHSMEDMARYADRLVVMEQGQVRMQGGPEQIFARGEELQAIGLDVPQITRLLSLLRASGLEIDGSVFTVDGAIAALLPLLGSKGGR
jgi:energy-coupling factor transport system ATP-binding protein